MFNNLHMGLGPVAFAELPHVDDIAIQNKMFWLDGFEVAEQLLGMTPVRAEVHI